MDEEMRIRDHERILSVISEQLGDMTPAQIIRSLRSIEEKAPTRARAPSAIVLRNLGPGAMQYHGCGIEDMTLEMGEEIEISPAPVDALPHEEEEDVAYNIGSFAYVSHAISVTFTTDEDEGGRLLVDSRGVSSRRAGDLKLVLEVRQENKGAKLYRIKTNSLTTLAIGQDTTVRLIGMGVSMNLENQTSTGSQQQERRG